MRLRFFPVLLSAVLSLIAADRAFTSYESVKPVLDASPGRVPAELKSADQAKWAAWSQREDRAIRSRLEQGDLESMVNLLLLGNSFTKQPRIKMQDLTQASRSGVLRARVDDLVAGLRNPGDNERLVFLAELLRTKGVPVETSGTSPETGVFILKELQRVVQERTDLLDRLAEAKRAAQPDAAPDAILDRGALFSSRGVSLDTGIFSSFSIEKTLVDLKQRGVLRQGQVARVAVIGPGLDFIDKNEESSYDYYPQQTLQPFALYDSVLRLGLARAEAVSVGIFDISSRSLNHLQRARERAMKNEGYVIQLPRDVSRSWPADLIAYWRSMGDQIGTAVDPIRPPEIFQTLNGGQGLVTRAVQIRPEVVLACSPADLNIVLQRMPLPEAERFDLIVATNIFVYYEAFEQSLALENVGAMLKPGGLLLTNDKLPEVPGGSMREAGVTVVGSPNQGGPLDVVGWYQRR